MSTYIKHNAGKFFLMENCPEPPKCKSFDSAHYASASQEYYYALEEYEQAIQSISAIEITNPEFLVFQVMSGNYYLPESNVPLKDNDTFLLPDTVGYEIEDEYHKKFPEVLVRQVARLYVKAEKGYPIEGDCIYTGSTHCQCMTDKKMPCVRTGIVKAEKGESYSDQQLELFKEKLKKEIETVIRGNKSSHLLTKDEILTLIDSTKP
jgi:hypothetical protein